MKARAIWLTTKGCLLDIHPLQWPLKGLCELECTNNLKNKSLNFISVLIFNCHYYLEFFFVMSYTLMSYTIMKRIYCPED